MRGRAIHAARVARRSARVPDPTRPGTAPGNVYVSGPDGRADPCAAGGAGRGPAGARGRGAPGPGRRVALLRASRWSGRRRRPDPGDVRAGGPRPAGLPGRGDGAYMVARDREARVCRCGAPERQGPAARCRRRLVRRRSRRARCVTARDRRLAARPARRGPKAAFVLTQLHGLSYTEAALCAACRSARSVACRERAWHWSRASARGTV